MAKPESVRAQKDQQKPLLLLVLAFYLICSLFLAFKLAPGIAPDEPNHFLFSRHYASTIGIPEDSEATIQTGWYIQRNPFLYYWINGRALNLMRLLAPAITEAQELTALRLLSVFNSGLTVYFCYLLAKELMGETTWAVLPPFLLVSTMMFTFLSASVSYDNLANLFSFIAIFYFVRALKTELFFKNAFLSLGFAFLGTLVKYPIVPLAFFLFLGLLVYALTKRRALFKGRSLTAELRTKSFALVLLAGIGFLVIYGYNLVAFRALTPQCPQILKADQCALSPYSKRFDDIALPQKMSISDAMREGQPDPLSYVFKPWYFVLLSRTYGAFGHMQYYPQQTLEAFKLWWAVVFVAFLIIRPKDRCLTAYLGAILLGYTLVLIALSYDSELIYNFRHIALHGRYYFPILGIAYVLAAMTIRAVKFAWLRWAALALSLALFLYGGPIKFILERSNTFAGWFLP